ncbi:MULTISPECIES: NUDIX hydrolase [unclassified Kitasatospora]|uniref:NUDIX hydrolase n=1 Tax=unclassified Kitasatospora TaxID=2633591 RepID=UPI0038086D30
MAKTGTDRRTVPAPEIDLDVLTDLALRDTSGRILMIRRAAHDVLPGLWEYPGGGHEDGEPVSAGAAREPAEETGISIGRLAPGPHHDLVHPLTRVLHTVWDGPETVLRLGDEGLALHVVPLDEVLDLKVPLYMHHYLPLLTAAADKRPWRTS